MYKLSSVLKYSLKHSSQTIATNTNPKQVASARRKETHFFDWRWKEAKETSLNWKKVDMLFEDSKKMSSSSDARCFQKAIMGATKPGELFGMLADGKRTESSVEELQIKYRLMYPIRLLLESRKLSSEPILVSGEATPSYLLYGETVARRIKAVAGHAKLIVAVRNPVSRAYSQYQMTVDPVGSEFVKRIRGTYVIGDKTFEDVVCDDMKLLKGAGLPSDSTVRYVSVPGNPTTLCSQFNTESFKYTGTTSHVWTNFRKITTTLYLLSTAHIPIWDVVCTLLKSCFGFDTFLEIKFVSCA